MAKKQSDYLADLLDEEVENAPIGGVEARNAPAPATHPIAQG